MYWNKLNNLSSENDKYWFVNENEIRVATWISLILAMIAFFLVVYKAEFIIALYIISIIWLDFFLKTLFSPNLSIFTNIVKIFKKDKNPYWVWAVQKRFAWWIWLFLSSFAIICLIILSWVTDITNPVIVQIQNTTELNLKNWKLFVTPITPPLIACILCIIFMWLESVGWFCVWCVIYKKLVNKWWLKKHKNQNCANWACEI